MPQAPPPTDRAPEERPPVFGSWAGIYLAVGAYLVLVIVLFDLFTRMLNR